MFPKSMATMAPIWVPERDRPRPTQTNPGSSWSFLVSLPCLCIHHATPESARIKRTETETDPPSPVAAGAAIPWMLAVSMAASSVTFMERSSVSFFSVASPGWGWPWPLT
ncbi:hypothetical protein [Streptomyces sp. NPDC056632]|uniref:hypothetical protein n=1 Tax=Streptomyces sp. NPDC056632 TaxID=3345884 RepID=UPI0036D1087A